MKITYKILASLLLIATLGACMGDKNPSDGEVEDKNPLLEEKNEEENKLLKDLKLSFEIEDEERGHLYIEVLSNFDKFELK